MTRTREELIVIVVGVGFGFVLGFALPLAALTFFR